MKTKPILCKLPECDCELWNESRLICVKVLMNNARPSVRVAEAKSNSLKNHTQVYSMLYDADESKYP